MNFNKTQATGFLVGYFMTLFLFPPYNFLVFLIKGIIGLFLTIMWGLILGHGKRRI